MWCNQEGKLLGLPHAVSGQRKCSELHS